MKSYLLIALAVCFPFFYGCESAQHGDPVVKVEHSDQAMTEAIANARSTFLSFVQQWKTMPSDVVSIKVGMATPDADTEHIWFEPIAITDTQVTARCANAPNNIPDLRLGDTRTFGHQEISDWMILVGDTCYGGYTIRVLSELEPDNAPPFTFAELGNKNVPN